MKSRLNSCILSDLANFRNGKFISPKKYVSGGKFPVYGSNGQIAETNECLNDKHVIVIGRVGAYCGSLYKIDCPSWTTDNSIVVEAKDDIDFNFLYYKLKTLHLRHYVGGSAQGLLTQETLKRIQTTIPSTREQRRIGEILEILDKKIAILKKNNSTLENICQTIFKSSFIDFDNQKEFIDSEFGKIPKRWKISELPEVSLIVDCLHITKPPERENNAFLLQVFNIVNYGLTDLTKKFHVSNKDYEFWTKNIEVQEGDCIVSNAGRVGAIAQIPYWLKGGIGRNLTAIRPTKITPTYLLEYLFSKFGQREIQKQTDTATVFNTLNVRGIKKIKVLIPPNELMQKFEAIARPLRKKMENNSREMKNFEVLRDFLITKLMSGEIRV